MASHFEGVHVFADPQIEATYRLDGNDLGRIATEMSVDFRGIPLRFWPWRRQRRNLPLLPPGVPPVVYVYGPDIREKLEASIAPFADEKHVYLVVTGVDFDLADVADAHQRFETTIWVMSPEIAAEIRPTA